MIVSRFLLPSGIHGVKLPTFALRRTSTSATLSTTGGQVRAHSVNAISPNISLITKDRDIRLERRANSVVPRVVGASGRPLVVILPWLTSKPAHVFKFATLYLDQDFDVLTAHLSLWQTLWPVNGSQAVATELLEFLRLNFTSEPLMLHGFSAGSYLWGEVCNKVMVNGTSYQSVLERVVGQVWDSAGTDPEIAFPNGISHALFPKNAVLKAAMNGYVKYHLKVFHEATTKHYNRSTQMFFANPANAPALFLVSKTDPIGTEEGNRRVHDIWASRGVQTYWKCWDNSPHVGHYRKHPKEYAAELHSFLDTLGLLQNPDKILDKM